MRAQADPSKLGLSSAQLFPGMDQTNDERKGQQAQQQQEWVAAQVAEKNAIKQAEENADMNYFNSQMEIQSELNQLISMHENTKQQFVLAAAAENKALAQQHRIALDAEKAATAEANMLDINAALTSAFLNEDPATTVSAANPNRPVPYHYKGLPPEYRQYVLDTQMQQAQAAHQQKIAMSQDGEAWDNFMLSQNTEATKMELAIEREKASQRKDLRDYHLKQAAEIKAREDAKEKTLRSAPEESFFSQFGTSSR